MKDQFDLAEIPQFLIRNPEGKKMTTPPPGPKPAKTKRQDCYTCRLTVNVPITSDPASYAKAIESVDGLLAELPSGSTIEFAARGLGKMAAC